MVMILILEVSKSFVILKSIVPGIVQAKIFILVYKKMNTVLVQVPRGSEVPHHPNFKVSLHLQKLSLGFSPQIIKQK